MDSQWISTKDKLPNDGEVVMIYDGEINVAKFERGISVEEREKMKRGEIDDPISETWRYAHGDEDIKRSKLFYGADEWGNNEVPYCWAAPSGPMEWFGQDVSHWMPLPEAPDEAE